MNKQRLCLALSVSLALLQANLAQQQVYAAPSSPSIWQKLAGTDIDNSAKHTQKFVAKKVAPHTVRAAVTNGSKGQVMLFLGKDKTGDAAGMKVPAAALTIHTALPLSTVAKTDNTFVADNVVASVEKPALLAMNTTPKETLTPVVASFSADNNSPSDNKVTDNANIAASPKQLLAQLAPDQVIAQSDTNTTPIPAVVTGTVDLEEFKPSNVIDLKVSQSRTFKLRNKIIRTSISDPAIAEPVVVAENQMVLLGKTPGGATLVIWDDAGNSVAIDVRVSRDFGQLQAMLREVDPRILVKPFSVGGGDRVILYGEVDHPESVVKAFAISNTFMDDRGMEIKVAANRILGQRLGETGGTTTSGAQQSGLLSQIGQTDRYTFFGNQNNNISRAQILTSDGGRVTSLIKVRKAPLIVLHCTFMEINSQAARELGVQLGLNFTSQSFGFSVGGNPAVSAPNQFITSLPGVNGTFGTQLNPAFGGTATFPNFVQIAPAGLVGAASAAITAAPGVNTIGGIPFFIAPGVNPQFGASVAPVNFFGANAPGNKVNLGLGVLNASPALLGQSNLFGIPGGAAFSQTGLANMFTAISNFVNGNASRWSVNPTVQGIIAHARARILAEPTLVTLSGERAAFLAGGEIPILQSIATAGAAAQSIVFEPFGLRLNMIPVLLENGSINMQVSPEERLLNPNIGFNVPFSTTVIPGFTTRKTQTTVEMKPGQELFICGLVSANNGREMTKTPLIGEVPILGALYRSKAFSKNESELVVAVRPEVILPGTPGQLRLPESIGKVEGARDMNMLQVEPNILDERHYTKGKAERTLKLPGVLPPDAPIPDR